MRRRAALFFRLLLYVGVPLILTGVWAKAFIESGPRISDFWTFWAAGRDVLHGHSPYPTIASLPSVPGPKFAPFVYPPSTAFLLSPVAVLPFGVAKVVFVLMCLAALALSLHLLGVRDWRCYAIAFGSAPFFGAAALGTVSILLLLGVACAWRYRDRAVACGLFVAFVVTAKLFLWPLWFWVLRSRRYRAAAVAAVASVVAVVGSWAAIGFAGMRDYPTLLSRLTGLTGLHSYSTYALARAFGAGGSHAQAITYMLGVAGLLLALRFAADERRSLVALLGVAFFATPILWTHYLVLLFVPIALESRVPSRVWLAPVLLWADATAWANGAVWRIVGELALVAVLVGWIVLPRRDGDEAVGEPRQRPEERPRELLVRRERGGLAAGDAA
jgi:hypothetical protein